MWIIIEEKRVRHRWECPDCDNYAYVEPWYYSENGLPVCTKCERIDGTMEYIHTELEIEK
jgi:hypothetical protein